MSRPSQTESVLPARITHPALLDTSWEDSSRQSETDCNRNLLERDRFEHVVDTIKDVTGDQLANPSREQGDPTPVLSTMRFEALYESHLKALVNYFVRRREGLSAEPADLASEVFAVAWRRLDEVPSPPQDLLWLYGAARKVLSNHRRASGRRARLHDKLILERGTPSSWGEQSDSNRRALIRAALTQLRPADQEVLKLLVWEDLSQEETAQVLGISINAVALRSSRARNRLGEELKRLGFRPTNQETDRRINHPEEPTEAPT